MSELFFTSFKGAKMSFWEKVFLFFFGRKRQYVNFGYRVTLYEHKGIIYVTDISKAQPPKEQDNE